MTITTSFAAAQTDYIDKLNQMVGQINTDNAATVASANAARDAALTGAANSATAAAASATTATNAKASAELARDNAAASWTAALAANPDLNPSLRMHAAKITQNMVIPDGYNALSVGPLEVDPAVTVTGLGNSTWRGV